MENIKILFGKKIKELRKKHNYTQAQLAEIVNVDDKHISCIESGKNFPSADLIYRLSCALGVEVKDLFENRQGNRSRLYKSQITAFS